MDGMGNKALRFIIPAALFILVILFLFPMVLALINAFKPLGEILGNTLGLPKSFYVDNFVYMFEKMNYTRAFFNTLTVTAISVVLVVLLGSMCAYKLSRTNDKKSWIIMMLFFSSMIIPFQTIMIPLAKVAKGLHLVDSLPGLILMVLPLFSPFAIFMFHGFVKTIPTDMDEAAKIDGCSQFGTFFKIIFPMLKPVTGSVVVLNALWLWNDFALPLVMLQSAKNKTVTITIYTLFSSVQWNYHYALAGLVLSALPIILFFIFMQRYIIKGVITGAVKG